jgi:hypothetical protein
MNGKKTLTKISAGMFKNRSSKNRKGVIAFVTLKFFRFIMAVTNSIGTAVVA